MDKRDALLVLPPMYQSGRIPDYNPKEPMGLMYVSAFLRRNGHSAEILDADILALTIEETVAEIMKRPAKIIGFCLGKKIPRSLLSWVKTGFSSQDIVLQITRLKDQLARAEKLIVSVSGLAEPILNVQGFPVTDLAGRIYSILVDKVFLTFPEQYRWRDD